MLAGLADKFGLSVTLLRFLFILFTVSHAFIGVIIYLLLDTTLPYKDEEEQEMFDYGPSTSSEEKRRTHPWIR